MVDLSKEIDSRNQSTGKYVVHYGHSKRERRTESMLSRTWRWRLFCDCILVQGDSLSTDLREVQCKSGFKRAQRDALRKLSQKEIIEMRWNMDKKANDPDVKEEYDEGAVLSRISVIINGLKGLDDNTTKIVKEELNDIFMNTQNMERLAVIERSVAASNNFGSSGLWNINWSAKVLMDLGRHYDDEFGELEELEE